jgi:hypothetical protein
MLIASSINGFLFGLASGQPLLILGPTGPFLVFEEMVYDVSNLTHRKNTCRISSTLWFQLCQMLNSDFWTVRCCVSLWTTFFIIMLVAFEGSFMIRHVTRFTEEIFAMIIALVYLYEPFKKLYKVSQIPARVMLWQVNIFNRYSSPILFDPSTTTIIPCIVYAISPLP